MGIWRQLGGLVLSVVLTFAAAGIGGAVTAGSVRTWYPTLNKPSWNPPAWVFGPVWSLLYTCMALAIWLAWRAGAPRSVLGLYAVQLALNSLWSVVFFGWHNPRAALVNVLALWVAILASGLSMVPYSATAGWLMLPYLAWVSFASVLNGAIVVLNR